MNIAVIGGTGEMGQSLIRFLNVNGVNAVPVGRKTSIPKQILENTNKCSLIRGVLCFFMKVKR